MQSARVVRVPLVGDRFVREGVRGWRDLATGCPADVRVHPLTDDWPVLAHRLLEEHITARGPRRLVDFDRVGRDTWFEARSTGGDVDSPGPPRRVDGEAANHVAAHVRPARHGIAFVPCPTTTSERALSAAAAVARRLRPLGFVTIRPGAAWGRPLAALLAHRHLALALCDARDRRDAIHWIRMLARTSPRAHVVADLAGSQSVDADARILRDRGDLDVGTADRPRQAGADARLTGVAVARRHLLDGELDRAESVVSAAAAEAACRGRPLAPDLADVQVELRFWQGRLALEFPDDSGELVGGREDARYVLDHAIVRGLVAWAQRNPVELWRLHAALTGRPGCVAGQSAWARAFSALASALEGRAIEVQPGVAAVGSRPCRSRRDVPPLARAATAEAFRMGGDLITARRVLNWPTAWRHAPPLHRWAAERLSLACGSGGDAETLAARIRRAAADGVLRWGSGSMRLLQVLPAVLQLVHDAEDEQAALAGCCGWLRRHSGAVAVAFLATDGQVVAGDGWADAGLAAADLADMLQATTAGVRSMRDDVVAVVPVRYAGQAVGSVVVRGPADRSAVLTEGAASVAAIGASALRARLDAIAIARESHAIAPEILGRSPGIRGLRDAIARGAAAPFPILIEGESGTGKELVARAIHRLSPRRDRRFSAVNCAALGDDLIEAELFGHARGAFTGAVGPRAGLFEDAHGGTLMLDEVSELSARAQAKLLRVLQEREVRRLGENAARAVDVRVVAATNRPLGALTDRGVFRADLLFRLAVVRIRLPPLHERVEDIPLLAQAFWRDLTRQAGKHARLGPDAVAALCRHRWPGNVRELQNVVAALVVDAPARGRTGARHVARVLDASSAEPESAVVPLDRARAMCERHAVASALARHGGRRSTAARELGLTRQGLAKAIKRLGLDCPGDHAGVA